MLPGTITTTVIVSAVTSAIVSVLTFLLSVRLAKDQGDRSVLRAIYQRLFGYFRDLMEAIEGDRPKVWGDYPAKGNRYVPVVREMMASGEASLIPDRLQGECEKLEFEALRAGSAYLTWVEKTYLPTVQALVTKYAGDKNAVISGRSYRLLAVVKLPRLTEEEITSLVDDLAKRELGLGLEFSMERGRTNVTYLYPDKLTDVTVDRILRESWRLAEDDPDGQKALADLRAVHPQLKKFLAKLTARIRDPHPLRETVVRAVRDVISRG